MTDRIDLDERDEESTDGDGSNRGDWFWRDGDAGGPGDENAGDDGSDTWEVPERDEGNEGDERAEAAPTSDEGGNERENRPIPHVPRETRDQPIGIPKASGGAGAGSAPDRDGGVPNGAAGDAPDRGANADGPDGRTSGGGTDARASDSEPGGTASESAAGRDAAGPHGGGVDDMTMALTYRATKRLTDPGRAFADAAQWADWIGVVGDVDAHVITKFQRDHGVDADFFNGTGTDPGERLRDVDEHSMFYAERMVVVGVADADEPIAAAAGWEFVPIAEAAEKAGWDVESPDR